MLWHSCCPHGISWQQPQLHDIWLLHAPTILLLSYYNKHNTTFCWVLAVLWVRICLQMTVVMLHFQFSLFNIHTLLKKKQTRASRSMKFIFGFIFGIIKNIWKYPIKIIQLVAIRNIVKRHFLLPDYSHALRSNQNTLLWFKLRM
jgi:hypothetical protein